MKIKTYYREVKNEEKHGIELYFDTIPTKTEREELKNNGYKWHSVKKCWYKRIADNKSKNMKTQNENPSIQLGVEKMENSYTGYGWQGVNSKKGYSMKEIAKLIKGELKRKYSDCTFSVTTEGNGYYSGLNVYLMKSKRNPLERYEIAVDNEKFKQYLWGKSENTQEQEKEFLRKRLESGHIQVNEYHIESDYELSNFGKELFGYIKELCDSFNFDDSDSMTDYFHCGFYLSLAIGKWDKNFELINE